MSIVPTEADARFSEFVKAVDDDFARCLLTLRDERDVLAKEITRLRALLKRTHIVLGLLTDDMHDEDIPPQVHALIADVRRIVREELARTPPQGQGEAE